MPGFRGRAFGIRLDFVIVMRIEICEAVLSVWR